MIVDYRDFYNTRRRLGLVAVPISFLLAELSYQFVENPFRRGGYKKTWTGYWAARPSMSEMKDGFAKAFWPLVPLIVVASLIGWALSSVTTMYAGGIEGVVALAEGSAEVFHDG